MKGNKKVIDALNDALSEELTAVNQYFLHSEMCENWGFAKVGAVIKKTAVDEMKHAEALIERILFLEGAPNVTKYLPLLIGKNVPEIIQNNLKLELGAIKSYNKNIRVARDAGDDGSAELFKKHLLDEEGHEDWLETQLDIIETVGLQNYLANNA